MTLDRRRHHLVEMVIYRVLVLGIGLGYALMTQVKIRAIGALGKGEEGAGRPICELITYAEYC